MKFTYRHFILLFFLVLLLTGCNNKSESAAPYTPAAAVTNPPPVVDLEVLPVPSVSGQPEAQPTLQPTLQPTPQPTPIIIKDSPAMNTTEFSISEITDEIFARIYGKSYPTDCTLDLEELRYLTVLHYGFDGETHVGELIVNKKIASATLEIFEELYAIEYPIEKLVLIDEYDADDEASMEDNNSSAFNYRFIAETTVLSNHALGFAIDINTLYNPYVYTRKDGSAFLQPVNAGEYVDRTADCPYYIRHGDDCYEIFTAHGFTWGGDWETKKDYQHFEYKH